MRAVCRIVAVAVLISVFCSNATAGVGIAARLGKFSSEIVALGEGIFTAVRSDPRRIHFIFRHLTRLSDAEDLPHVLRMRGYFLATRQGQLRAYDPFVLYELSRVSTSTQKALRLFLRPQLAGLSEENALLLRVQSGLRYKRQEILAYARRMKQLLYQGRVEEPYAITDDRLIDDFIALLHESDDLKFSDDALFYVRYFLKTGDDFDEWVLFSEEELLALERALGLAEQRLPNLVPPHHYIRLIETGKKSAARTYARQALSMIEKLLAEGTGKGEGPARALRTDEIDDLQRTLDAIQMRFKFQRTPRVTKKKFDDQLQEILETPLIKDHEVQDIYFRDMEETYWALQRAIESIS